MTSSPNSDDVELQQLLERYLKEGRLADVIVDLLTSIGESDVYVNGVAVARAAKPPTSDKSCYKKCLKDCLGASDPDKCYAQCIKNCKPKSITVEVFV